MREIKFRAWDIEEKIMSQSFFIGSELSMDTINKIFLQFTGLKDRNNKEIYEGDIISDTMDTEFDKNTVKGVVEQDKYGAWIFGRGYVYDFDGQCEIIDNIYENPEILEERR